MDFQLTLEPSFEFYLEFIFWRAILFLWIWNIYLGDIIEKIFMIL